MQINKYLDSTLLSPVATEAQITQLCNEAVHHEFAAVCIHPCYVKQAYELVQESSVKVCTVVGFPLGATTTLTKLNETAEALAHGASEIDMVINLSAVKSGYYELVKRDISEIVKLAQPAIVKVIVETSLLSEGELRLVSKLALEAGAAYVKTSTGFGSRGASSRDIEIMNEEVGSKVGIKASGGIKSFDQAMKLIKAGATRIGTSSALSIAGGGNSALKG